MGYTLTQHWQQREGAGVRERRETCEAGHTYADAEAQARTLWSMVSSVGDTVGSSAVVSIEDVTGRVVATVKDGGEGKPTLSAAGDAATLRWLGNLREAGILATRVRRSMDRVSDISPFDLPNEASAEILDACASRLGSLILRVDDLRRHGLATLDRGAPERWAVRWGIENAFEEADVDGYLEATTAGRIGIPPSTLPHEELAAARDALIRVSTAMLLACGAIEAFAAGETPEPVPAMTR